MYEGNVSNKHEAIIVCKLFYSAYVFLCSHSVYKICVVKQESEIRANFRRLQMIALVAPPNNNTSSKIVNCEV